jgi:hypothetical protein
MFLPSNLVSLANPLRELIVEIAEALQAKSMEMISGRESFDAPETWMFDAARKNKVADQIISPHGNGDERHPDLERDPGFLGKDLHWTTFPDHRRESVEQFSDLIALADEVCFQADVATRVTLVTIGEPSAAFGTPPKRRRSFP